VSRPPLPGKEHGMFLSSSNLQPTPLLRKAMQQAVSSANKYN
jgi:hypothetical protein